MSVLSLKCINKSRWLILCAIVIGWVGIFMIWSTQTSVNVSSVSPMSSRSSTTNNKQYLLQPLPVGHQILSMSVYKGSIYVHSTIDGQHQLTRYTSPFLERKYNIYTTYKFSNVHKNQQKK